MEDAEVAEQQLTAWASALCGNEPVHLYRISGGNRCIGWRVTAGAEEQDSYYMRFQPFEEDGVDPYSVRREAGIYAALQGTGVPLPRLIASHDSYQALLTELVPGRADYRRIKDEADRARIADQALAGLAKLHALDIGQLDLPGIARHDRTTAAVRAELDIWDAMYRETGRANPLIEFGYAWLTANMPDVAAPPSLVHGDAGPGNFMFLDNSLTALIDWELAHPGDPMEDLAWFSMRSVMEPVPDFPQRMKAYEQASGTAIDKSRVYYHRAFVSFRVLIIRHRNSSGDGGTSLVSRTLNQRLLVEAIAEFEGVELPDIAPLEATDDGLTDLYGEVLDDLRDVIVPRSTDALLTAKAKSAAKAIKYLQAVSRFGASRDRAELAGLSDLLGHPVTSQDEGNAELVEQLRNNAIPQKQTLLYFAAHVARDTELASASMGGLARRKFPKLS